MTHNNEFIDTLLYFQSGNKQSDAKEKCGMRQAFAEVFILLEHFDFAARIVKLHQHLIKNKKKL